MVYKIRFQFQKILSSHDCLAVTKWKPNFCLYEKHKSKLLWKGVYYFDNLYFGQYSKVNLTINFDNFFMTWWMEAHFWVDIQTQIWTCKWKNRVNFTLMSRSFLKFRLCNTKFFFSWSHADTSTFIALIVFPIKFSMMWYS